MRTCAVDVKNVDRAVVKPGLQLRRCELQDGGKSGVGRIGITCGIRVAAACRAVLAAERDGKGTALDAERADRLAEGQVRIAVDRALRYHNRRAQRANQP